MELFRKNVDGCHISLDSLSYLNQADLIILTQKHKCLKGKLF